MIAALRGNAVMAGAGKRGEIDVDCFRLGGKVPIWHDQPRYGVEAVAATLSNTRRPVMPLSVEAAEA